MIIEFACKECDKTLVSIDHYSKGEQVLHVYYCSTCNLLFVVNVEDRKDFVEYDYPKESVANEENKKC